MVYTLLKKLRELSKIKQFTMLCAAVIVAVIVVLGLIVKGNNSPSNTTKTAALAASNTHLSTDKIANASTGPTPTVSPSATPGATTTTVLKTATNSDGTTTKQVASYVSLPFATQSQDDVNLKRGTTQVQAGQTGIETIVYTITYDQSGKEISRKTVSDIVTTQPVTQITKVGISGFNLNTDTWDGIEFGEICLPSDHDTGTDGCVGTSSDQSFSAVEISGIFYAYCVDSVSNACRSTGIVNLQPVVAVHSDSTFSYQGTTYRADPRAGAGGSQLLTAALCSQYGLACGSW